jgi:Fanconi anemia group M protein
MASPFQSQELNPGPCEGFDDFAGRRWIYPVNMPVRGYQKTAVEMALFHNAMIVLPTGFGKTFIAAVVMYNFYNWYPQGKIIFVAPTRPLVAQQINECKKVSGIPYSACVEITGMTSSDKRQQLIEERRVIFATPQVIENDLNNGILPAESLRAIIPMSKLYAIFKRTIAMASESSHSAQRLDLTFKEYNR